LSRRCGRSFCQSSYDEARADRIGDKPEHDRDGASCLPQRRNGRAAKDKDYIRCQRHQFGRVFARIVNIASAPAVLDLDVVPDSPAQHEHADATHPLALLCARRERPSSYRRRTAKQRDELASLYVEHGLLPGTRCASLPQPQPAPEAPAGPWGRPESF
jgi:hypothetical protein